MPSGGQGRLRLDLFNVYGDALKERVDIFLHHQTLNETVAARNVLVSKAVSIANLRSAPHGLYRLFVDPPSYLPVSQFVTIPASGTADRAITFAFDVNKVVRVEFPAWNAIEYAHKLLDASPNVPGFAGLRGRELYASLDATRRAGLLNILAKCRRTRLSGGGLVIDAISELRELRGDRFFATVSHELREHVKNSVLDGLLFQTSGALHRPPDGFTPAGSFKTIDSYGNLQLTFFANGTDWVADIDIDDAAGLGHVFQVARNALTGRPTHPYDIHQILLRHQEIDTGYRLLVTTGEEPARRRAATTGPRG
jgi:hypothetical protein